MRHILKSTMAVSFMLLAMACGQGAKEKNAAIGEKKAELEKLKSDYQKTGEKIDVLEKELAKLDTTLANVQKAKLVSVQTLQAVSFDHYIELQGRIDAENISNITPRGAPGQVKEILVKQGQYVHKGQLLMRLDDAIQKQNVTAAKQKLSTLNTQLSYSKDLYQRQKNLWDEKIGTEIQVITAKNTVEGVENQIKEAQEGVKVAIEQLNTVNITSDVDGVADVVTIRLGEVFSGQPGTNGIKIVNTSSLKVVSTIPENYLGNVHSGAPVIVNVPDINKSYNTTVSFVGASIDLVNRGFTVEARLPSDQTLKPNLVATVKVKDYSSPSAIAIPVATMQTDEKGKFVMVASTENGKLVARKRPINIGMLNGDQLEVKMGLKAGDVLVTEGFQSLYDGLVITTQ